MPVRCCPQCGAKTSWTDNPFRPFCSERCRMIDLSHWFGERYRVPSTPVEDESESPDRGHTEDDE